MEILFWIWVLTWMMKTAATDVIYSLQGQTPPRQRARLARIERGEAPARSGRYGLGEWFADLKDDALRAHTEKRRAADKAKAQPVDDMVELVREPAGRRVTTTDPDSDTNQQRNAERARTADVDRCPREGCPGRISRVVWPDHDYDTPTGDRRCNVCGPEADPIGRPPAQVPGHAERLATVIPLFPNPKEIDKMETTEATGLTTAVHFAEVAAAAHTSFATSGAEGYVGALERMGMGETYTGPAREAMEASTTAAAKWTAVAEKLREQTAGQEFYRSNADAADKQGLINE